MDTLSGLLAYGYEHPLQSSGLLFITSIATFALYLVYLTLSRPYTSTLRDIPGPPSDAFISGNLAKIFQEEPGESHLQWQEKFGEVSKYTGFFGEQRLLLADPAALNYVLLSNAYDFPKPDEIRGELAMILGKGVLFAEGEDHRRQRRIMSPAFSPSHIRELVPIFFERTYKLRELWVDLLDSNSSGDARAWADDSAAEAYKSTKPDGEATVELCQWLNRLTLDIIGQAGFGVAFESLEQSGNRLGDAFTTMFSGTAGKKPTVRGMLVGRLVGMVIRALPIFKIADYVPLQRIKKIREGFRTLEEESMKIIKSKQGAVEKDGLDSIRGSKDLIALLLKAIASDSKASMSQNELRGQLTTFLLAGHETTSTSTTWTLYTLSQHRDKQERLRQELRTAREKALNEGREELEPNELDALPYLDAVVREILRLETPVVATIRHAGRDDHIPLSTPIPSAVDPSKTITSVEVKKGQILFIPIAATNKSKRIFGEDAREFRPERWIEGENGGFKIEGGVGLYSHILTFLAGPRGCIGYRFALLELKAILSVLVDEFDFSLRDDDLKISHRSQIVTRPLVIGEEMLGARMPLRIRRAKREE